MNLLIRMARKNKDGHYILSAGEVGAYTVCPESWRLKVLKGIKGTHAHSIELGSDLHRRWAEGNEEVNFFRQGVKLILILISAAIVGAIVHLSEILV